MKKITAILIVFTLIFPCGVFAAGESASFSPDSLSLYTGEVCGVSVSTSAGALVWNISEPDVVSLFGDYYKSKSVCAKNPGTATISVSDTSGNILGTLEVTVSEKPTPETTGAAFTKGDDIAVNKNVFGEHLAESVNYTDAYRLVEENISFGSARVAFKPSDSVTDYIQYSEEYFAPVMRNDMTLIVILSRFVTDSAEKLMEQVEAICSVLGDYQESIYIEFGNEIYGRISDSFTIEDYITKCKALYPLVKEYGESIEKNILTAVPILDISGATYDWSRAIVTDQSYYDAVVPHLYTNVSTYNGYTQNVKMQRLFSSNENMYESVEYAKEKFPGKEIWITEYGTLDNAMLNGATSAERARLQSSKTLGVALCNVDKALKFLCTPEVKFSNYHIPNDSQLFGLVQNSYILPGFYAYEKLSDLLAECTSISELHSDNVPGFGFVGKNFTDSTDVKSVSGYGFSDLYGLKYLLFINRAENPCEVSLDDRMFKSIWEYSTEYVLGEDYLTKTGTFVDLPADVPEPFFPADIPVSESVTLSGYSMTVCALYRDLPENITAECSYDGRTAVPVDADIELEFTGEVCLTSAEISVLGNGVRVPVAVEGSGSKYEIVFEKEENTVYEISVGSFVEFVFKTAYKPDDAVINSQTKSWCQDERKRDVTLDVDVSEPLTHSGTTRFITLEDTTADSEFSLNFIFSMQNGSYGISWYTKDASASGGGMGPSNFLENLTYENIQITINDYLCTAYTRLAEGTYMYLGEVDLKSFRNDHISNSGFKFNKAEIKNTSLMSINIGINDAEDTVSVVCADKYGNISADTSDVDLNGIIICSAYDSTSLKLYGVQFKDLNEDDYKIDFNLDLDNIENIMYKVFIWNYFDKIVPLINPCIYKFN